MITFSFVSNNNNNRIKNNINTKSEPRHVRSKPWNRPGDDLEGAINGSVGPTARKPIGAPHVAAPEPPDPKCSHDKQSAADVAEGAAKPP